MNGCTFKDCRVPPSRHNSCAAKGLGKCWGGLEHQHVPKRSQTPRDKRECPVRLCSGHHGGMTASGRYEGTRLADRIRECRAWGDGGATDRRRYEIYSRDDGSVLVSILLGDSDMGGGDKGEEVGLDDTLAPPSVPGALEE